jgi:diamine N-acetyltransferase
MGVVPRVALHEVTAATVRDVCRLEVAPEQRHLVAPNAVSIAQAYFEPAAWFRAIHAAGELVGFAMLYDPTRSTMPDDGRENCWLWRFMIDSRYQRHGYGSAALALLIEHVRTLPGVTHFKVSFVPGVGNASSLYGRAGFRATGEVAEGEAVMALALG